MLSLLLQKYKIFGVKHESVDGEQVFKKSVIHSSSNQRLYIKTETYPWVKHLMKRLSLSLMHHQQGLCRREAILSEQQSPFLSGFLPPDQNPVPSNRFRHFSCSTTNVRQSLSTLYSSGVCTREW